jgi:hypothetical protein
MLRSQPRRPKDQLATPVSWRSYDQRHVGWSISQITGFAGSKEFGLVKYVSNLNEEQHTALSSSLHEQVDVLSRAGGDRFREARERAQGHGPPRTRSPSYSGTAALCRGGQHQRCHGCRGRLRTPGASATIAITTNQLAGRRCGPSARVAESASATGRRTERKRTYPAGPTLQHDPSRSYPQDIVASRGRASQPLLAVGDGSEGQVRWRTECREWCRGRRATPIPGRCR